MDIIHLIGADDVRSAGHTMSHAADDMRSAASSLDSALERHQRFMDDWLQRFEDVMTRSVQPQAVVVTPPTAIPNGTAFEPQYAVDGTFMGLKTIEPRWVKEDRENRERNARLQAEKCQASPIEPPKPDDEVCVDGDDCDHATGLQMQEAPMKLSNWNQAAEYVARLKTLEDALDAVKYNQLSCTVIEDAHSVNPTRYILTEITSVVEMRKAIGDVLRAHIISTKAALKTYGVDIDA